jgi:hypothetical protein
MRAASAEECASTRDLIRTPDKPHPIMHFSPYRPAITSALPRRAHPARPASVLCRLLSSLAFLELLSGLALHARGALV